MSDTWLFGGIFDSLNRRLRGSTPELERASADRSSAARGERGNDQERKSKGSEDKGSDTKGTSDSKEPRTKIYSGEYLENCEQENLSDIDDVSVFGSRGL